SGTAAAVWAPRTHASGEIVRAWMPFGILSVLVCLWGLPQAKTFLDGISVVKIPIAGLHQMVQRMPPVVPKAAPEGAVYVLNWLSATGTGILIAAIISGFVMGLSVSQIVRIYGRTLRRGRGFLLHPTAPPPPVSSH